MELSEPTTLEAVESLVKRMLVSNRGQDRVNKYSHRLRDRRTPEFDFSIEELAVLSTLFLRGAQTPGEIRTRCNRLHNFPDMDSLFATLERLAGREDGPYVKQLSRRPGQKEARYAHLFCGDVVDDNSSVVSDSGSISDDAARINELEIKVSTLQKRLTEFEGRFNEFVKQLE